MSDVEKTKAIAIVGPTASGKTALSIDLAHHFNGEVISADSRQVYRGLDIGSAKVTKGEMADIPHHLINVVDPAVTYTGADFKRDGDRALADITNRGKVPIVAGGTFFYLELLKGTMSSAPVPPNLALRAVLEQKSTAELFAELQTKDPRRAEVIDAENPRRLIRALEIIEAIGTVPEVITNDLPYDWLTIGIDIPTEILNERIHTRILDRLKIGMVEEVTELHKNGLSWERLEAIGLEYRYIAYFLQNKLTHAEMIEQLTNKSRQFAKRQKVWLKRDKNIHWLPFPANNNAAILLVEQFLKN